MGEFFYYLPVVFLGRDINSKKKIDQRWTEADSEAIKEKNL